MRDANDPVLPGTSDVERLRTLFADAFGPDVLPELPLRLRLAWQRPPRRRRSRREVRDARCELSPEPRDVSREM